jgi:hypothetical protein
VNEPVAQAEPLHVVAKDAETERKRQQAHLQHRKEEVFVWGDGAIQVAAAK